MGLELQSYTTDRGRVATYKLTHSTPGRNGTILDLVVRISDFSDGTGKGKQRVRAEVSLDPYVDGDAEAALDKLAEWMERAAEAIRKRGTPSGIVSSYAGDAK